MKKNLFIYFLLCICASVSAQSQQWKLSKAPAEYDIWDITMVNKLSGSAAIWDSRTGANAKIISTNDGGKTWTQAYDEIFRGATAIDRLDDKNAFAVGGANNYLACWKSNNNLNSFTPMMQPDKFIEGKPSFWSVDFISATHGFGGASVGKILKTTNGGSTWTYLPDNFTAGCIVAIHFINQNIGFIAKSDANDDAYRGRNLYKTVDGGKTWTKVFTTDVIRKIYFQDEKIGFCVGGIGGTPRIWRTNDGGENWRPVFSENPEIYWMNGISFTPNKYVGYAVGGNIYNNNQGAIFKTTDGGLSWEREIGNLPTCLLKVSFFEETNGIAVGTKGYTYYAEKSKEPPFVAGISISDTAFNLGTTAPNEQLTGYYTITAQNPAGITITNITSDDKDFAEKGFTIDTKDAVFPLTIEYGDEYNFEVHFTNSKSGGYASTITFKSNDAKQPVKTISVLALCEQGEAQTARISVSDIKLGTIEINDNKQETFFVGSKNSAGLEIDSIYLAQTDDIFLLSTEHELPFILFGLDSIKVTVNVSAMETGLFSNIIMIKTSDAASPVISIPISVTISEKNVPTASLSLSEVDFGNLIPDNNKESSFKIYSANAAGLIIHSIIINDNTDNYYSFTSSKSLPATLTGKDSVIITVKANPKSGGIFNRSMLIETNNTSQNSIIIPLKSNVIISGIDDDEKNIDFSIYSNSSDKKAIIRFSSPIHALAGITISDSEGRNVATFSHHAGEGINLYSFDTENLASGIYFVSLSLGGKQYVKKMILTQ